MKNLEENPVWVLLIIIILFGLAYGPVKNANLNNNTASTTNSSITSQENTTYPISTNTQNQNNTQTNEVAGRSPYYGKVKITNYYSLYNTYNNDPSNEYISLSVDLNKNETLKITGWYLKSEVTGYYAMIGGASLLPFLSTKNESDVILKQGDRVSITKGFSPIGVSFRTNKCIGYFNENRTFVPGIPMQCPLPRDEKLPTFSSNYDNNDECINVISRIQQCTTVNSEFIRDLPDTVPSSCKTYLTTQINYNTCVALHAGDTDFAGNEYHLYLNKFGPLWRKQSDKINLYDQSGLIVDTIRY